MNRILSNILVAIEVGILGLIWALALNLPIFWTAVGCIAAYFILAFIVTALFGRQGAWGCGFMWGGIVLILIVIGLIVWLVRLLTKA